jgi:hypothetical protein
MHTEMRAAVAATMPGKGQPLRAQLDQVMATRLPDGREVWQVDITLAIAPGVWTLVVDDPRSIQRLYEEILSSGNERFGRAEPAGTGVPRDLTPEELLNDHEGAEFDLLSLIH